MWQAAIVAECLIACGLVRSRWPALFAFLAIESLRDVIGWWAFTHWARLYWWNYYAGDLLIWGFKLALLVEIGSKLCPSFGVPAMLRRYIPIFAFIVSTVLAVSTLHQAGMVEWCRKVDFALSVGCATSVVMLYGCAISLKVQFSHGVKPIALGFLLETGSAYVLSYLAALDTNVTKLFSSGNSLIYLIALLCFAAPLWRFALPVRVSKEKRANA
jgi:hypothetical protein